MSGGKTGATMLRREVMFLWVVYCVLMRASEKRLSAGDLFYIAKQRVKQNERR
jgi:hypothetical protein